MIFNSRDELNIYLKYRCKYLGSGSEADCYFDRNNTVLKIFNFLDPRKLPYQEDKVLQFKGLDNDTFKFANGLITINQEIVGYTSQYVEGQELNSLDPLRIDLRFLEQLIIKAREDIVDISKKDITLFDILFNIMIGEHFFIKDCDDFYYNRKDKSLCQLQNYNKQLFDSAIYYFLIDCYFDDFVTSKSDLKELYDEKKEDILIFLKLLRKYLSEYIGQDVQQLSQARKCLNKTERFPLFFRTF